MTDLFQSPYGLFPCQQEGAAFGYTQGSALLCADTGIGKSVIAMAMTALLFEDDAVDHVILVCKTNKITEWLEDLAFFTPLTHRRHHGPGRAHHVQVLGLPQVLVSTYETLRTDFATFSVPPGKRRKKAEDGMLLTTLLEAQADDRRILVIYDEISDKLRNRGSQLYKAHDHALQRLRVAQPDLRAVGLTATPLARSYEDGYNLLRLLTPGTMPNITRFERAVIARRDDYGRPTYREEGVQQFIAVTRPHVWRKRKTDPDVREMFPKRIEDFRKITMGEKQARLYQSLAALQEGEQDLVPGLHVALRQLAGHPAALVRAARHGDSQLAREVVESVGEETLLAMPSAKTEVLVEYLSPIIHGQGDKAVVFSQFGRSVLPLLEEALRREGIRCHLYTGEMSAPDREAARRAFRTSKQACVLLASDAGKDGINLPEASYVIEYESATTYETRTQRLGRIDRINSGSASITCTTFVLTGTIEESLVRTMLKRNEMTDRFLGDEGSVGHVGALERRRLVMG